MKKNIIRNIAIVSAVFIVAFVAMLVTNYFQVKDVTPLQTEVVEMLKQINDQNAGNVALQEQIRRLDLLARRAYFVRMDNLLVGIYILVAMLAVFLVSLHLYFSGAKNIPDKQIAPIDEWLIKTDARKYVRWAAVGFATVALVFALLSMPALKLEVAKPSEVAEVASEQANVEAEPQAENQAAPAAEQPAETLTAQAEAPNAAAAAKDEATANVTKVTHNGFRGNSSNAVSEAKNIPTQWNLKTGENIAWTSKIPRGGFNSPVVNAGKVFVSGADEQARELYCYDLQSGKLLWTAQADNIAGSPAAMPKTTDDTGLAASTVATNGKQVCAIFASGDLICTDTDGKRLWAKNLGVPDNHYGYASSLLAYGNALIVQYDNTNTPRLLALDMASGKELWSKNRTDKITWSSPIIAQVGGKPQLVLMGNPSITAYNPTNGEQLWRVEGLNGEVAASPCSAAGMVFGASEYASLIAVDAAAGTKLWEVNDYLPEVASPVATKENVYVATSYGMLACYNAKDGTLRHSHELNTEFYSSPMIVEERLYIFSNSGKMFIYNANSEFGLVSSFETGEKTFATPAFVDGKIVVRTEGGLYCVGKNS
ncbi:MAG: PQQ-binding-like beta-propeller repeat protein [Prevotellaceae bacterium]|jgi:outer membrane protein assembly factor BamB|nr:PQQ-binding-like beta-propeller repeat protein [Prevotellaceae bacterium]